MLAGVDADPGLADGPQGAVVTALPEPARPVRGRRGSRIVDQVVRGGIDVKITERDVATIFDLGVQFGEDQARRNDSTYRMLVEYCQALTDGRTEDADRLRRQLLGELGREEGTE